MMICMMMTATAVCGIAVDVVDIAGVFVYCFFMSMRLLVVRLHMMRSMCRVIFFFTAMCMSCARGFVIMSRFLSLTGSGKSFGYSSDNSVRIWDVNTQQQVAVLTGHTSSVTSITFDVSGKYLASGDLTMMMT